MRRGWRLLPRVWGVFVVVLTLVGLSVSPADAAVWVDDVPSQGWGVNGRVYATVIAGDTVFVGGTFTAAVSPTGATLARKNLAAFSMSTGEPLAWKADAGAVVRALVTDGTSLWAAGSFGKIGGKAANRVAKLSVASGAVDTVFSANAAPDNTVRALALSEGKLYAGGVFLNASGLPRTRLAKFDAQTGVIDPTFNASANNTVMGLAANPATDALYASGSFTSLGGVARNGVGAVSKTTGALQSIVFGSAAKPTLGLVTNATGSMLYGAGGSGSNAAAAWDTSTGARKWRQVTDGDIQAIAWYDNTVYFGMHDGYQQDGSLKVLAADGETGQLQTFYPRFDGFWGCFALAVSDKGLVAGGEWSTVSGVPARNFVRFAPLSSPRPQPVEQSFLGATTQYSYWDQDTRPANWQTTLFDESTWQVGLTQLGYGDGDEATVISYGGNKSDVNTTAYFRARFTVDTIPDVVRLELLADDGAVVYINGLEAVRDNMPDGTITHDTKASTNRTGGPENALRPFSINPAKLRVGNNVIAVEVHQSSSTSDDLSFDAELTGVYN